MKIALIHFQPLEYYPPVMNCIHDLEALQKGEVLICTTHANNNWFDASYSIYRLGNYAVSRWVRYWIYLYFNLSSFCLLCYYRPKKVLYYETYSAWPVYWYKKLFPKVNVFIHFHEYISDVEKKESSTYFKFLLKKETALLKKAIWISHTNEDRMRLFQQDYPFVRKEQCFIIPNYPPVDWATRADKVCAKRMETTVKRMVYVGALGMDTTYIKEIAAWIEEQKGVYTLGIYANNIDAAVLNFLEALNSSYISIREAIPYFELPEILATYDIGLVLYKGYIPNYIYNIPNKIHEYLSCGLQVWYSEELISTNNFKNKSQILQLFSINFNKLDIVPELNVSIPIDSFEKIYESNQLVNKLITA